jgi:hypothetical protein
LDLQKRAKLQREQDLEPSKVLADRLIAGELPAISPQEYHIAETWDSDAEADRLDKIRNRAYAIWLDEGRCEGRHQEHWNEAEREIDAEEKSNGTAR